MDRVEVITRVERPAEVEQGREGGRADGDRCSRHEHRGGGAEVWDRPERGLQPALYPASTGDSRDARYRNWT